MQDRSSRILMHHYRNPVANRLLDYPNGESERRNPLCGDEIHVQLKISDDNEIEEIGWQAKGCMLVTSSASILSEMLKGKKLDHARDIAGSVLDWLQTQERRGSKPEHDSDRLTGDLAAFNQMSQYPARIPCIKLAWQAFLDATTQD